MSDGERVVIIVIFSKPKINKKIFFGIFPKNVYIDVTSTHISVPFKLKIFCTC